MAATLLANAYPFPVEKSPGVQRVDSFGEPLDTSGITDDTNGAVNENAEKQLATTIHEDDDDDDDVDGGSKTRREYVIPSQHQQRSSTTPNDSVVTDAPFDPAMFRQSSTASNTSRQKVLFDMCKYPDNTFDLVRHDDVTYTKLRSKSESGQPNLDDDDDTTGEMATVPVVALYYDQPHSGTDMRRASSLPQSMSSPPSRQQQQASPLSNSNDDTMVLSRNASADPTLPLESPPTPPPLPKSGSLPPPQGRRVSDIVTLFDSSQNLNDIPMSTSNLTADRSVSADDYKLASPYLERRDGHATDNNMVADHDDDDDDDGRDEDADVSRSHVQSLIKLYDVSHSPKLERPSDENQQHLRKPFTSLLVNQNDSNSNTSAASGENSPKHVGKENSSTGNENDIDPQASYWDQLDRRMSKKKPNPTTTAAVAATTATAAVAATAALTCTCCGGAIGHEQDNISYFVDDDGDCFYAPDSRTTTPVPKQRSTTSGLLRSAPIAAQAINNSMASDGGGGAAGPERVYTHKTLGTVSAKPSFNRFASAPGLNSYQQQAPPMFMTMNSLPNGYGQQPQFMPVFMTPQPGMMAPTGTPMGLNTPTNMSCNQSIYSFQAADTRSMFPNLPAGQTPMALIPMPVPGQCATCAHNNNTQPGMQIQYVLAPIMPVMQMPLSQIPEDQQVVSPPTRQLRQRHTVYRTPSSSPPTGIAAMAEPTPSSRRPLSTGDTALEEESQNNTVSSQQPQAQVKRRFSIKSMLSRKSKSPIPT